MPLSSLRLRRPTQGFSVIIAGAGKAAHLAGVMAAKSLLPVIGVPLSASLQGLDALLATVQMPTGIPVATVAVDGSANAALLAVAILALHDDGLARTSASTGTSWRSRRVNRFRVPGLRFQASSLRMADSGKLTTSLFFLAHWCALPLLLAGERRGAAEGGEAERVETEN